MVDERVINIARKVRSAFEDIASNYNYPNDLTGLCKRASVQFFLEARKAGFKDVKLVAGQCHVYNSYNDYIIDITATQFGKVDKIYITGKYGNQKDAWDPKTETKSVAKLNRYSWSSDDEELKIDKKFVKKYVNRKED